MWVNEGRLEGGGGEPVRRGLLCLRGLTFDSVIGVCARVGKVEWAFIKLCKLSSCRACLRKFDEFKGEGERKCSRLPIGETLPEVIIFAISFIKVM